MAFVYDTVTIGAYTYSVYMTVTEADEYLTASLYKSDWDAASDDDKDRAIVMATRLLDRQAWQGSKTDSDNELEWPRTGLTDVDDATIPDFIEAATAELANMLLGSQDVETFTETEIKSVGAGTARVEFFRDSGDGGFARFPTVVQELVGKYLDGNLGSGIAPTAYGTDEEIPDLDADLGGGGFA